jgi:hypothetical protein
MSTNRKPKAILAIWHTADKGKTETLREIATLLLHTFPRYSAILPAPSVVPPSGDFRLVVNINGRIVAVESRGDPNTNLLNRLQDLATNFCADVIFCSTRTKGDTVAAVDDVAASSGFEVIWTSTYQTDKHQKVANRLKAEHVIDLMRKLSYL